MSALGPATAEKAAKLRRLGIAELEERLGYERTTIYRWYKAGKFPPPHYLGRDRLWFMHEVEQWEAERMSRTPSPPGPASSDQEARP